MDAADREWLNDMLEHAKAAVSLLGDSEAEQVVPDMRTVYAVSHAVLIVGEAAGRVSPTTQADLPSVPWRKIIGMRHRLVHGYRMRSVPILMETVREHLPPLIAALEHHLGDEPE
jgi:uncharacterized protein with HEPN domain